MKNQKPGVRISIFAIVISVSAWTLAAANNGNGRGCVSLAVSSAQAGNGAAAKTFALSQIIDLDFSVLFSPGAEQRFEGAHEAEFRLFTPHGFLYQSLSIPFTSDPRKQGQKKRVRGYPDPMEYRILRPVGGKPGDQLTIHVRLPVAGTPIANNSLLGAWKAEVYIDGEALPCSQAEVFSITR